MARLRNYICRLSFRAIQSGRFAAEAPRVPACCPLACWHRCPVDTQSSGGSSMMPWELLQIFVSCTVRTGAERVGPHHSLLVLLFQHVKRGLWM